jgi:hypothetical protein
MNFMFRLVSLPKISYVFTDIPKSEKIQNAFQIRNTQPVPPCYLGEPHKEKLVLALIIFSIWSQQTCPHWDSVFSSDFRSKIPRHLARKDIAKHKQA